MRLSYTPTLSVRVAALVQKASWPRLAALLIVTVGCESEHRLPNYRLGDAGVQPVETTQCAAPAEGCPCAPAGNLVDCGELRDETDGYVTCLQGVRLCRDDGTWGACTGALVKQSAPADPGKSTLALGSSESCTDVNPCDPLCRQFVDTGAGITQLPEGLCSTASGLTLCPLCGYSGPVADLPYASIPADWQRVPTSCSSTDDRCPLDTVCVDNTCKTRAAPCGASNPGGMVDLTLGKPCFDPADPNHTYHIPLCNRGAIGLTNRGIRIGIGSQPDSVNSCAGPATLPTDVADRGIIELYATWVMTLAPGKCMDVNVYNSVASNLDLSGNRSLLVNFNGDIAESNYCNNASVAIVQSDSGKVSTCTNCFNLECSQTDPATTLNGIVYDPSGRHPLPDVIVYVPNGPVAPLVDGTACDSCNSIVSGSPIAWTKTDPTGHFSLPQVPSARTFPLVIQLGRWRRQFIVASIPAGQTRWVAQTDASLNLLGLSADANEPTTLADYQHRLRLPATERRCVGYGCAGEGDIPKTALILGDADPIQCTLRRIGIADSEFTGSTSHGRVQLFRANGMQASGAIEAMGVDGLLSNPAAPGAPRLFDYAMLLAPCNAAHGAIGRDAFATSPYGSGPSFNGWPDPTASDLERANVRDFTAAGGRLIATHWLSMDLVYLNAAAPPHATLGRDQPIALLSPHDPSSPTGFSDAIASYATSTAPGFAWQAVSPGDASLTTPILYLFGNNVSAASNTFDVAANGLTGGYAPLKYGIDTSTSIGQTFSTWAAAVGATQANGSSDIPWQQWSPMVWGVRQDQGIVPLLAADSSQPTQFVEKQDKLVAPQPEPCLELGDQSEFDCSMPRTWSGPHVGMFQFDTPMDATQKCGRVAVASGHVSQHQCHSPSNTRENKFCGAVPPYNESNPAPDCDCLTFPAEAIAACDTSSAEASSWEMSREELAFEYLYFSAAQCIGELAVPPATQVLPTSVFVRDFEADCASHELPVWRLWSWQSVVPSGARIDFTASTADTEDELASSSEVLIGTASQTTTTWTSSSRTIDNRFRRRLVPPDVSRRWLRVKALFVPNRAMSPTLTEWRVVYNCVASE